mmetsp:Transcript_153562/g.492165  ORF Transcript_153562/g.492165 Transcript_153562/m.492165 type:complete len:212 (+) Transcript_153562:948-1583(+)
MAGQGRDLVAVLEVPDLHTVVGGPRAEDVTFWVCCQGADGRSVGQHRRNLTPGTDVPKLDLAIESCADEAARGQDDNARKPGCVTLQLAHPLPSCQIPQLDQPVACAADDQATRQGVQAQNRLLVAPHSAQLRRTVRVPDADAAVVGPAHEPADRRHSERGDAILVPGVVTGTDHGDLATGVHVPKAHGEISGGARQHSCSRALGRSKQRN